MLDVFLCLLNCTHANYATNKQEMELFTVLFPVPVFFYKFISPFLKYISPE